MFIKASIVVPCRNEEKRLEACLRSIMRQDLKNIEIIVVNDGSTDGTQRVAEFFADDVSYIHVINLPPSGVTKALNAGLRVAKGEYLGSIGADDRYLPGKLSEQAKYLDDHPEVGMVFGWPEFIDENGEPFTGKSVLTGEPLARPQNRSRADWAAQFGIGNCLFGPTCLYRRQLHEEFGFFDERLTMLNDLDFYIRVIRRWDFHVLQRPVSQVCIRDGVSSPKNTALAEHDAKIICEKYEVAERGSLFKHKVIIATPFRTMEAASQYIGSLVQLVKVLERARIDWDHWGLDGDSYADRAKNTLAQRFFEMGGDPEDCLFYIDSDEDFDVLGFWRVLLAKEEVVGANYMIKNNWGHWGAKWKTDPEGRPIGRVKSDGSALLEAEWLTGGFLRIKRSALQKYHDHYTDLRFYDPSADPNNPERLYTVFFERRREGLGFLGEDRLFCKRWAEMGGTLWIEPNVTIGHYGVKCWKGNLDQHLRNLKTEQDQAPVALAAE